MLHCHSYVLLLDILHLHVYFFSCHFTPGYSDVIETRNTEEKVIVTTTTEDPATVDLDVEIQENTDDTVAEIKCETSHVVIIDDNNKIKFQEEDTSIDFHIEEEAQNNFTNKLIDAKSKHHVVQSEINMNDITIDAEEISIISPSEIDEIIDNAKKGDVEDVENGARLERVMPKVDVCPPITFSRNNDTSSKISKNGTKKNKHVNAIYPVIKHMNDNVAFTNDHLPVYMNEQKEINWDQKRLFPSSGDFFSSLGLSEKNIKQSSLFAESGELAKSLRIGKIK